MDKFKYIIAAVGAALVAYMVIVFSKSSTKKSEAANAAENNIKNAAADKIAAEAEYKRQMAENAGKRNEIITNNGLSVYERQGQIDMLRNDDKAREENQAAAKERDRQLRIKNEYDRKLASYNALSTDEKWNLQSETVKNTINKWVVDIYEDMKGGNAHRSSLYDPIKQLMNDPKKKAQFRFFVVRYGHHDGATLSSRMGKQNWLYCRPGGNGIGRALKALAGQIATYADSSNDTWLNKKAGDVIPGYYGEIPADYKK